MTSVKFRIAIALPLVAAVLGGLAASAAVSSVGVSRYRLLVNSIRDGKLRVYSVRSDGSDLTPLFRVGCKGRNAPTAVSRDGRTIAFTRCDGLYVARANGTGVRRLAQGSIAELAPSPNGKLIAFTSEHRAGIWSINTDGRDLRQLTSGGGDAAPDWSPDSKALVYMHVVDDSAGRYMLVVHSLRGRERVLFRTGPTDTDAPDYDPTWSPDGRWIAYGFTNFGRHDGLYLIRANGSNRHRIATEESTFAWAPDGKRLAIRGRILSVDGGASTTVPGGCNPAWSPDGNLLASDNCGDSVSVVGTDGRGLRRIMTASANHVIGWTPLAPVGRAAPTLLPSEHVVDARTVATRRQVTGLSADGPHIAFTPGSTGVDCGHVVVWTPADKALRRFDPPTPCSSLVDGGPQGVGDVELAGLRVAWVSLDGCGSTCHSALRTAVVGQQPVLLSSDHSPGAYRRNFYLHGDDGVLVYGEFSDLLTRIGAGTEQCPSFDEQIDRAKICTTIVRGGNACCVESVFGGLIAIHRDDAVAVVDESGKLVHLFQLTVAAARLDGHELVVARANTLQAFDAESGAKKLQRPLPKGFALADVDGGIAVLRNGTGAIKLLRLDDARSFMLSPGRAPRLADLEDSGLYYSYGIAGGEGRVVFLPHDAVERKLGS